MGIPRKLNKPQNLKKYYSSIILLIFGGLLIKTQVVFGDRCSGLVELAEILFFSLIYLVVLFVIMIIYVVRKAFYDKPMNYIPLWISCVILALFFVTHFALCGMFESEIRIYAYIKNHRDLDKKSLTLRQDGCFEIETGGVDWVCLYPGKYKMNGDTIFLNRKVQTFTDSLFSDKYLIEKSGKYLYPLDREGKTQDTTRRLTIKNPK